MNCIVPFKKSIKFDTPIAEITSISLEHEITVNDGALLGNFLVTGEYKEHPVSVNVSEFKYNLPFDVTIPTNVIKESITFDVTDFTYQIEDNNSLQVNIEFVVRGDEINDELEEDYDEVAPEILTDDVDETEERADDIQNVTESANSVLSYGNMSEETFVTYHVHILKENDTIESLAKSYNISDSLLGEYNDLNDMKPGNKIIIPIDE